MTSWLIMYQNQLTTPPAKPFQGLYDGAKKTLKDIVEKEAEEEQQQEEDRDLTQHEHERTLK